MKLIVVNIKVQKVVTGKKRLIVFLGRISKDVQDDNKIIRSMFINIHISPFKYFIFYHSFYKYVNV